MASPRGGPPPKDKQRNSSCSSAVIILNRDSLRATGPPGLPVPDEHGEGAQGGDRMASGYRLAPPVFLGAGDPARRRRRIVLFRDTVS